MSDTFSAVCFDPDQAHTAAKQAFAHAQALLRNGENVLISCGPALEPVTVKQRKFLHGPVLGQISEQVRVGGERYVITVWKEYFRKLFLPDTWELRAEPRLDPKLGRLVQPKRATPRRVRSSTEELGPKAYAEHTEKIIDYATVEWGVVFQFTREEQDFRARKPKGSR